MKTSLEYLTGPEEPASDPNSRQKNFDIVPAKDKDSHKIFKARLEAVTDHRLAFGARNFFTFLLDLALNPRVNNDRRGEITISTTQLCEWLDASPRAIYGWTKELVECRHIWVSKMPRPNMHPMNVFHITAMQPMREIKQDVANDGLWGNGYRRPGELMPLGARGAIGKKRHYLLDRLGRPLYAETPENSPATRNICSSLPQNLREAPAKKDTCHPQNLRGAPAKKDTRPPQKQAVLIESQLEIETPVLRGEAQRPPSRAVWERKLEKLYPDELKQLRADLLKQQKEVDPADKAFVADISLRIEAIDRQLYGAAVPKRKQPRPVTAMPLAQKDPTTEELVEGAKYLASVGKEHLLTPAQRALIERRSSI